MKAWIHGTTWGSDPGPMGAGIVFDDGKDWCVALSGWGTTDDATWNALSLCVEYAVTEYEVRKLIVVSANVRVVTQANFTRWRTNRIESEAMDFWYLCQIARKLGTRVKVKQGEVRHASVISNAAAEIAADTVGIEPGTVGELEGENPD
jgi:hypothetical protein